MRYTVRKSTVSILGNLWQPGITAGQRQELSIYDVENLIDDDGNITRASVEDWLTYHSGDFAKVIDFSASIEDGENTVEIGWSSEENEMRFNDCMCPSED